jgi:hypothetical protein
MLLAHEAGGRSLLADPAFLALARAYESVAPAPRRATIRDATEGHWYALALVPGAERKAIDRVADDVRVATYLPMRRELRFSRRGRPFNLHRALFTGYGFVLAADIEALFGRITACEGVRGIMCEDGEPAIVRSGADNCRKGQLAPQRYDHGLIEFIRAIENGEDGGLAAALQAEQEELERAWREQIAREPKKARSKRRTAAPPVLEIAGLDY